MDVRFVYDLSYVKQIIKYLGIPFLLFLIVSAFILITYYLKHKDHDDPKYKYTMNLYTLLMSIILVASLFAVLLGFALAFKKQVDAANIKSIIVYIVLAAPILPFFALLALFTKAIKLMKNKPVNNKDIQVEETVNNSIDKDIPPLDINITEMNNINNASNSLLDIPPASANMFSAQNFFPNPNIVDNSNKIIENNQVINKEVADTNEPIINEVNIESTETIKVIEEPENKEDIEML